MKNNKGLAFKLSLSILMVVLLIMVAMLYYNFVISRNRVLDDAIADAEKLTDLTVARIENVLKAVEHVPENLAAVIENRDTILFVGTRRVMEKLLEERPLIYGSSISYAPRFKDGDSLYYAPYLFSSGDSVVFKDLAKDGYNYHRKEWYKKARNTGRGVWSEPYYDEGGGDILMATYSVPFYRVQGNTKDFAGVITADISLVGLQNLIQDIQFYDSGKGFLISSEGNILTFPGVDTLSDGLVHNIFREDLPPAMFDIINRMVQGEKGIYSLKYIARERNEDTWVSFASVPSANWSLGILFLEEELYAGIYDLFIKLIAIGLAGMVLLVVLVVIVAGRIVKPLEKLASATKRIGAGDFDFRVPSYSSADEIGALSKSFNRMQDELKDYIRNLQKTTAEKEKFESELKIASSIQQQMLSKVVPVPGKENLKYFGVLKPAKMVGGDLYDFILRDRYLYFVIGDVSGKGIPAALFMAKTLTLFRAKVTKGKEPRELGLELNRDLEQYNAESMFVTLFIGKLDVESGELAYTNAGHNPPFLFTGKSNVTSLPESHGLPVGSLPSLDYGQSNHKMEAGEKIILYTDGVTEAMGNSEFLYGDKRFKDLLAKSAANDPEKLARIIISDVAEFASGAEQSDDITLFILEYN